MSLRLTVRQRLLGAWERGNPGRRGCVKACEIQVLQTQKHVSETDLRCAIGLLCLRLPMCGWHAGVAAFGDRRRWKL